MRDVIVIGAGGGGPVVAKELARTRARRPPARGGCPQREARRGMAPLRERRQQPRGRLLPLRAVRPDEARVAARAAAELAPVAGKRRRRDDAPLLREQPARGAGRLRGYKGRDRAAYDREHRFPFSYRSFVPYYEWVEHTLPVQTAAMGTKEETFLEAAAKMGLPLQRSKDITRRRAPAAGERDPSAARAPRAGPPTRDRLVYPKARGCTFCGHCFQGCYEPRGAPRNLAAKRSTDNSATCRWR